MFEEYLSSGHAKDSRHRDRAVGALVTVLVHAILGVAVYHGRFTVKILPFEKEETVRNIVIVPPLKVSIPKIVGGQGLSEVPILGEPTGPPGASQRPGEAGGRGKAEATEEAVRPAGVAGPRPEGAALPSGAGSAIPSLSSKFRESLAIRGQSALTIPLAPPGTPAGPPGVFGGGAPLPDFTKYGRGAYGEKGGYGSGRGGGGVGGRQRIGMSIPLKGYDLLPWASVVIDRLQINWLLPSVAELPDPAKVVMIVVIKKNGELDSIEIIEGTTVEVLDRAALGAIRAGLPFPALPADFPGDLLEITFEFVYND